MGNVYMHTMTDENDTIYDRLILVLESVKGTIRPKVPRHELDASLDPLRQNMVSRQWRRRGHRLAVACYNRW